MINHEIKSEFVNVVNDDTKGLTKMLLSEAIGIAEEEGLDVICLNSKGDIPVVKIGDYGKYQYEKQKKEKDNRKKARLNSQDMKEISIRDSIAEHDLKVKAHNIDRLLKENNKVKLVIVYKGRSIRLINQGPEKLQQLAGLVTEKYNIDKTPRIEGNKVTMVLSPIK